MTRIETGSALTDNLKTLDSDTVRFVSDDGRTMFEVSWNTDGKSIDVRGAETSTHNGVLLSERLDLRLRCANVVTVMARPYAE